MKKDSLTEKVFEMYQEYPFPGDITYNTDYFFPLMRYFSDNASLNKKSLLEEAKVIEVGCGTGNTLIQLASKYPNASFTGIDMTVNSLNIARENAKAKDLKNISFLEKNLLELDLNEKYDIVLCIGVLHHLADMNKGLENIIKLLNEGSHLILWLYGRHGRNRLNLNQKMLELLLQNVETLKEKVDITKSILKNTDDEYTSCHFNVPDLNIEDKWSESIEFVLNNDSWLVDQFLHYNEKVVDIKDILAYCKSFKMQLVKWLGVSDDIADYINVKRVKDEFDLLKEEDKLLVLDYLLKPKYYSLILKKLNSANKLKI